MQRSIAIARIGSPQQSAGGANILEFQFNAGDPTFAGHFPGHPILPGIFQLEMVRVAAETVLDCPLGVREIRKAKFQRPILPDEVVRLELKLSEKEGAIEARAGFSVGGQSAGETFLILSRNR